MPEIQTPKVNGSLNALDYKWIEAIPEEIGKMIARKLKQLKAKAWSMDVYCSNNQVYRNILIRFKDSGGNIQEIRIRFNPHDGHSLSIISE